MHLTAIALRLALALPVMAVPGGCGLLDLRKQSEMAEQFGQVSGRVERLTTVDGVLQVVAAQAGASETEFVIRDALVAGADGSFRFPALRPGTYFIGAFVDANGDGVAQPASEPVAYYNTGGLAPEPIAIAAGDRRILPALAVRAPLPEIADVRSINGSGAATRNIGRTVFLSDPMFTQENAALGLWRPVDFLKSVGGGLFMLQDYDPARVPVVFVHGMNGNPLEWAPVIEALDKTRFQPWVLYYPSGLRLDVVSEYLDRAIDLLGRRYGVKTVQVVAHSMGGLVARTFVQRHQARGHPPQVNLLVTINSPLRGMASATKGVDMSPIVVPAWRDVALNSDFIVRMRDEPWPDEVPWHLVFAYTEGEDGDGVVPLDSQIPLKLQPQAVRIHGFRGTHAGLLADAKFLKRIGPILESALP
jgi:pimeloyl-ACP methyl ester carboxylesterase